MYKLSLELTEDEMTMLLTTSFPESFGEKSVKYALQFKIANAVIDTGWLADHSDLVFKPIKT